MYIVGLTLACLGTPIALYALGIAAKIGNSTYGYYRLPYGMSRDDLTTVLFFAVVLAIIGFCLMFFAKVKEQNKNLLNSIANNTHPSHCSRCGLNVSSQDGICPICGRNLREE